MWVLSPRTSSSLYFSACGQRLYAPWVSIPWAHSLCLLPWRAICAWPAPRPRPGTLLSVFVAPCASTAGLICHPKCNSLLTDVPLPLAHELLDCTAQFVLKHISRKKPSACHSWARPALPLCPHPLQECHLQPGGKRARRCSFQPVFPPVLGRAAQSYLKGPKVATRDIFPHSW